MSSKFICLNCEASLTEVTVYETTKRTVKYLEVNLWSKNIMDACEITHRTIECPVCKGEIPNEEFNK